MSRALSGARGVAVRRPKPARGRPLLGLLLLFGALSGCGRSPKAGAERPNVVVVLADSLRAPNLEIYGYPRTTAPHLAALAEESVRFADHLANYPWTPYSVSQLLTGRLMPPLLMRPDLVAAPTLALTPDLLVLPQVLKEAGYRTALVSAHPWFERSRALESFDEVALPPPPPGEPYARFESLLPAALGFVDRAQEPFFLYLHSMDTHSPFRFHAGYDRHRGAEGWPEVYNAYDSEIEYTDDAVGRLLERLRANGRLDRTLFVFTSDHGEELGEMGEEYWNRSHGYTVRRVQLHVPFLLRLPGGRLGGSVRQARSEHLDVAPTLLRLALPGVDLDRFRFDGRDLGSDLGTGAAAGSDPAGDRSTVARSWRYWALHAGDLELHWDAWLDRSTLFQNRTSRFNYTMSIEADQPAIEASMAAELTRIRERRNHEERDGPTLEVLPPSLVVGIPTTLLSFEGSPPTYDESLQDDRWRHDPTRRLEAGPDEAPGAVTLGTIWVPGRYRFRAHLDRARREAGWTNRFRVRFPLADGAAIEVEGESADADDFVDLGVHDIGRYLAIEVSDPRGGVALVGFSFDREGAVEGEEPPIDDDLRDRLEALGYLD